MYVPGNVVLAAAGNVEHERLLELVHRAARAPAPHRGPPVAADARAAARAAAALPAQGHRAVQPLPRAPGISRSDKRRFAASLLDAILGGSASSRLFQEIREKRGMAYAVYSFVSQYTDTGQIGVYVGTREENLADASRSPPSRSPTSPRGNLHAERAPAREGQHQGPDHALDGVDLEPDEPARQVARHRDRAALLRADHRRDRAVEADEVGELAALLLAPERLAAAGIGPSEERFLDALEGVTPMLARAA